MKGAFNYKYIHPKFKLNGISYEFGGLQEIAYSFIKEGKDHEKSIGYFLSDWLDDKSSVEVRTSGSTGKPKKILLQKRHMVNSAFATGSYFDLEPTNTALLCLSVDFIAGKMMLVRALVLGLALDYVEPSTTPLTQVQKNFDFSAMVPLQLENSLNDIEAIKKLLVGGAPLSTELKNKVQHKFTKIYETYGMTETITHVAIKGVNGVVESASAANRHSRGYFNAMPNVTFLQDERQCLVIKAPKVSDDPVVTNDIVNLISETQFEWLSRYDNVINSGGVKLFPEQIEAKLASVLTNRFFVAAVPDKKFGQKLILVVEGDLKAEKLFDRLRQEAGLERFEVPKNMYILPKFIETDTGKILRKENLLLIKT
jgi:O-succinylbenzoic acid--CoA ligase